MHMPQEQLRYALLFPGRRRKTSDVVECSRRIHMQESRACLQKPPNSAEVVSLSHNVRHSSRDNHRPTLAVSELFRLRLSGFPAVTDLQHLKPEHLRRRVEDLDLDAKANKQRSVFGGLATQLVLQRSNPVLVSLVPAGDIAKHLRMADSATLGNHRPLFVVFKLERPAGSTCSGELGKLLYQGSPTLRSTSIVVLQSGSENGSKGPGGLRNQ
ncbi:hypothetical protein N7493_000099 [Penicillium malachiteum]|uniref:Uncharacterized protein n=1 Tax=Penicillium malachiteum TaxID=1324776 RepID=A0AAD6HW18_9EURO|nr:hypothetical protein N7493_000099 [Penicillium malachiteum]